MVIDGGLRLDISSSDITRLSNVRYGIARGYAVVAGNVTPASNIPTMGSATYVGGMNFICGNSSVCTGQQGAGNASFDVNFDEKSIVGTYSGVTASQVEYAGGFNGNIVGKSFFAERDGNAVSGAFFGNDASQLGGVFTDINNDIKGSFGATKQQP